MYCARTALVQTARSHSTAAGSVRGIDASALRVVRTRKPAKRPANETLVFGRTFTDHMLSIPWSESPTADAVKAAGGAEGAVSGWETPQIHPFADISLHPAASVLHYGLACFEGLKAYKDAKGAIRLFRPDMNMARFRRSCERLALPSFDEKQLLECIKHFVRLEHDWVPDQRGYSLYLRPTAISTQPSLGVTPPKSSLIFVIASPVGPYYKNGFSAVSLHATTEHVRAWPGGVGNLKLAANYAPCIYPQQVVSKLGYDQNLWLLGPEQRITEVGTMNLFVHWINEDNELELITAPLDGTILPGVTRDSILEIARKWGEFKVSEKTFTMPQLERAIKEGRVKEIFGSGTAAIVSPVKTISVDGRDIAIPLDPKDPKSQAGPLTTRIFNTMMDIQYGIVPSEWSVEI